MLIGRHVLAHHLGVDTDDDDNGLAPKAVHLSEAMIENSTGGAVSVHFDAEPDDKGGLTDISLTTWRIQPNGDTQRQFLIELDTAQSADKNSIEIKGAYVLGRYIDGSETQKIARVLEATRRINLSLREGTLPNVAKIFADCFVEEVMGESLKLMGFDAAHGVWFPAAFTGNRNAGELKIRADLLEPLLGYGENSIDLHRQLGKNRRTHAINTLTAQGFQADLHIDKETKRGSLTIRLTPNFNNHAKGENAEPVQVADISWRYERDGQIRFDKLQVIDEDLTRADRLRQLRGLGVVNRVLHDFRNRAYPFVKDHLTEYDSLDLIRPFAPPPALEQGGRFYMVSLGGNNTQEIFAGFGEELGGNCKALVHEGIDKNGNLDRCVVIHDLGIFLAKPGSEYTAAAPDVVEYLRDCEHIMITHLHLDHKNALSVYTDKGFLREKTVHATPSVIRSIVEMLRMDNVDKRLWPRFEPLEGKGFLHIEKDGVRRFSVQYSADGTPHTARTTPMRYIARYGDIVKGSYLNPGDMRYGRHYSEDYEHPKGRAYNKSTETMWLDEDFFRAGMRDLAFCDTSIRPESVNRPDTFVDYDITSIRKKGWAPIEPEVRDNLQEVEDWFGNVGILMPHISTNENRHESGIVVAAKSGRDITEFGAAVQRTASSFNVLGVNRHMIEPQKRANTQAFIDMIRMKDLEAEITAVRDALVRRVGANDNDGTSFEEYCNTVLAERYLRTYDSFSPLQNNYQSLHKDDDRAWWQEFISNDTVQDHRENGGQTEFYKGRKAELADSLFGSNRDEGVRDLLRQFDKLQHQYMIYQYFRSILAQNLRYQVRPSVEHMWREEYNEDKRLDVIRVTRTSRTAYDIMYGDPSRRFVFITGTQGTPAEAESTFSKLVEGRSLLDFDPAERHTARKITPDENVLILSQMAIPGNEQYQRTLISQAVARHFTVVEPIADGVKIHNPGRFKKQLLKAIAASGRTASEEQNGALVVLGIPIHAPGHGYEEDAKAWLRLIQGEMNAAQHTSDLEAIRNFNKLCDRYGLNHPKGHFENFEAVEIDMHAEQGTHSIGFLPPSVIAIKQHRRYREFFGGHMEAKRFVLMDGRTPLRSDGLMGVAHGHFESRFGVHDAEAAKKRKKLKSEWPEPTAGDMIDVIPLRRYEGARLPDDEDDNPPPFMLRRGGHGGGRGGVGAKLKAA